MPCGPVGGGDVVDARMNVIEQKYLDVLRDAAERRRRLEETRKLYSLNRETDEIEAWVREKMIYVKSEEVGNDVEQANALESKFQDFEKVQMEGVM